MLRVCRRRWRLTCVWLGFVTTLVGASVVRAEGKCRLDVQVEGAPDGQALAARLREEAVRGQACSRPWTLRVSPGPRGQFIVALWNGSTLETRWASNAREIEPVASLLMRVAVERAGGPEAGSSAPMPSGSTPGGEVSPPPSMEPPAPFTLGAGAGPMWAARSGAGVSGTLSFLAGGSHLRVGLTSHLDWVSGDARRTGLGVGVIGVAQTTPSPAWRVGLGVEVGGGVQHAEASVAGQSASQSAVGFEVGAAPFVGRRLGSSWWLTASVPVRLSTISATAKATTTTTTTGKPADTPGNGSGKDKTTTITTPPTAAAIQAADSLGGITAAVLIGVAYEF